MKEIYLTLLITTINFGNSGAQSPVYEPMNNTQLLIVEHTVGEDYVYVVRNNKKDLLFGMGKSFVIEDFHYSNNILSLIEKACSPFGSFLSTKFFTYDSKNKCWVYLFNDNLKVYDKGEDYRSCIEDKSYFSKEGHLIIENSKNTKVTEFSYDCERRVRYNLHDGSKSPLSKKEFLCIIKDGKVETNN